MIRKKIKDTKIIVDLNGPQGNAFYLLGLATKLSEQLGYNTEQILSEMKESDYETLVLTFDKYFGDHVILEE